MSSLIFREEWCHPQGFQKPDKTIGTSRSPWEMPELLVDLLRMAGLFLEPANSPRVMYLRFCFQTAPTFSRLHSWHRKSWYRALNTDYLTVPSSSGDQGTSSWNHKLHWNTLSPNFSISTLPQAPGSMYLPQDVQTKIQSLVSLIWVPPVQVILWLFSQESSYLYTPHHMRIRHRGKKAHSQKRWCNLWSASIHSLRKASWEGFYLGGLYSIFQETRLERQTHGDLLDDLPAIHDVCYTRNNSSCSRGNDMSNVTCVFFLMAYTNILGW